MRLLVGLLAGVAWWCGGCLPAGVRDQLPRVPATAPGWLRPPVPAGVAAGAGDDGFRAGTSHPIRRGLRSGLRGLRPGRGRRPRDRPDRRARGDLPPIAGAAAHHPRAKPDLVPKARCPVARGRSAAPPPFPSVPRSEARSQLRPTRKDRHERDLRDPAGLGRDRREPADPQGDHRRQHARGRHPADQARRPVARRGDHLVLRDLLAGAGRERRGLGEQGRRRDRPRAAAHRVLAALRRPAADDHADGRGHQRRPRPDPGDQRVPASPSARSAARPTSSGRSTS